MGCDRTLTVFRVNRTMSRLTARDLRAFIRSTVKHDSIALVVLESGGLLVGNIVNFTGVIVRPATGRGAVRRDIRRETSVATRPIFFVE